MRKIIVGITDIINTKGKNEDGESKQDILLRLQEGDPLILECEDADTVIVFTEDYEEIGKINKANAKKVDTYLGYSGEIVGKYLGLENEKHKLNIIFEIDDEMDDEELSDLLDETSGKVIHDDTVSKASKKKTDIKSLQKKEAEQDLNDFIRAIYSKKKFREFHKGKLIIMNISLLIPFIIISFILSIFDKGFGVVFFAAYFVVIILPQIFKVNIKRNKLDKDDFHT